MPKMPLAAPAWALVLAVFVLLGAPTTGYAGRCDDGQQGQNSQGQNSRCEDPPPAATPELDSVVLFGAGLLGLGGVAFIRRRATSRPEPPGDA
jgi:MYXO-CTERM domain-containing protein